VRRSGRSSPGAPDPGIDSFDALSDEWLDDVLGTPDSDIRAHKVAFTYSQLAASLDEVIRRVAPKGEAPVNANWFHFATWGTVTITANIGNQRPPQRIDHLPLVWLRRQLTPIVIRARAADGQRVSQALSWGQQLIFVSVCFTLQGLTSWMQSSGQADAADFHLLDAEDRPDTDAGDRIIDTATVHGRCWIEPRRHLRVIEQAFRFYVHASRADDPVVKARCVLGGNLLLTAVEQDLVDAAVEAVVNHIPRRVAAGADQRAARWAERWLGVPSQVTGLNLPFRYPGARAVLDTAWSRLMTDQIFVMALPTETLRLGRDIPPRQVGEPYYPAPLRNLGRLPEGDPPRQQLEEVARLVASFDRTNGDGRGSAARDWRRWDERMNWALTLLRSRQQDRTLYWPPYSRDDQRRIRRDELPLRGGDPSTLEVQPPIGPDEFLRALENSRG